MHRVLQSTSSPTFTPIFYPRQKIKEWENIRTLWLISYVSPWIADQKMDKIMSDKGDLLDVIKTLHNFRKLNKRTICGENHGSKTIVNRLGKIYNQLSIGHSERELKDHDVSV
jgi:hypothetical protein